MKLGLITDIHESLEYLRAALQHFQQEEIEQLILIGDVFEQGRHIRETCKLLAQENAIGVWGNHDFGLSCQPTAELREKFGSQVIEFMTSLQPRLTVEECHFTHVEPWLDPEVLQDLWYFEGSPDEHGKLARIFNSVPDRILFSGHYHKWLLATPNGILDWKGDVSVSLSEGRFYVVIGALCEGGYAMLETESWELTPFQL